MATKCDVQKCLQELEGTDWGEPNFDSHLVSKCHRLRRVALAEFSTEDLRIMIGQQIGLPFLIPLALDTLEKTPLADGDLYEGDLLHAVLGVPKAFWADNLDLRARLQRILKTVNERHVPPCED